MYRLLFADDEHIVREGVSTRVNWGANGFELVGAFSNGREVVEYLQDHEVDVLLSDISMPHMDGLAVCREVSSLHPQTLLLLLTGYDQFEYAQEALKYQVNELLLKPITAEELEGVLDRVREELDQRAEARRQEAEIMARLEESIPVLKAGFLHRLVLGQLTREVITRRTRDLHWRNLDGWYQTVLVYTPSAWNEIHRLSFTEQTGELLAEADELFANSQEHLVLLLQEQNRADLEERTEALAPEILRISSRMDAVAGCVAIGEPVPEVGKLSRSYSGARHALSHARLLGLPQVVRATDIRALGALAAEDFHDLVRDLAETLRRADRNRARQALDAVFTQLEEHYVEPEAADAYLARIQFALLDLAEEMGRAGSDLPPDVTELLNARHFSSLAVAREHYTVMVDRILDHVDREKQDAVVSRIGRAEQVIRERFSESGLSLQDICDEVFLSVSQFSVLFKEATGRTFVEYLTSVRMEQACELLRSTDLRTYEIADQVGYTDPRYFTYVFKKAMGMTSSEYRKEHHGQG